MLEEKAHFRSSFRFAITSLFAVRITNNYDYLVNLSILKKLMNDKTSFEVNVWWLLVSLLIVRLILRGVGVDYGRGYSCHWLPIPWKVSTSSKLLQT